MKNVTITIDDETHRAARIRAAELGTSLSAMVKDYLQGLAANEARPTELREMPMTFAAQPASPVAAPPFSDGPPYFVDGKWVYTKDGKPRRPGALRGKIGMSDDFDEWPDGFIDAMLGEDTEASENWYK